MVAQGNKRLKEPEINLYSSDDFDGLAILGARPEPPRFDRRYGFLIQSEPERFEHLDIDRTPDRIDFYVEDHSAHEVADPGRLPVLRVGMIDQLQRGYAPPDSGSGRDRHALFQCISVGIPLVAARRIRPSAVLCHHHRPFELGLCFVALVLGGQRACQPADDLRQRGRITLGRV